MIDRCFDLRRVKRLANGYPCISRKIFYLVDTEGSKDIGLWSFQPHKNGYMVHADMVEGCRGLRAGQSAKDSFRWMFTHADCETIYAEIPIESRNVQFMARHVGMSFDGIEAGAFRCYSLAKQTFMEQRSGL